MAVYTGAGMAAYGFTRGSLPDGRHYYDPGRFTAFAAALRASELAPQVREQDAPPATDAELLRFHSPAHLEFIRRRCAEDRGALDHGPTPAQPHMPAAAASVVGAVLDATPTAPRPRAPHRPPPRSNHRLRRHRRPPRRRRLGTPSSTTPVVLLDIHQHAASHWYSDGHEPEPAPIVTPRARSFALNAGAGDPGFAALWPEQLAWLGAHTPAFIVLNAGADGLAGDRLGSLLYSPRVHARVARDLVALADHHADGRLLALGGGGYHPPAFTAAWLAVISALLA
ncbi:hypothetical protein [Nannocystis sp.]|uniref:hypothetical protein n=1 Tax=Nannocystis sp. TaxID=1962667 RepID=UPI0025F122BE|nr:hypothetical protein [Nannocystis sp.]MBK7829253.1 hypothetical protein [Nannocystis sp.]